MYTTAALNRMLDALGVTHVSAWNGDPTAGGTELDRVAISYAAAANGNKDSSNQPGLAIGAGAVVRFVAYHDAPAAGTLLAYHPNGASRKTFTVDAGTNRVQATAHGLSADQRVVFYGGAAPGGLALNTVYFVVNPTANDFQVAAAAGGAAIDITGAAGAGCAVSPITEEAFGAAGTFTVMDSDFSLSN